MSFLYTQSLIISAFVDYPGFLLCGVGSIALILYFKGYGKEAFFVFLTLLAIPYSLLLKGVFKVERPITAVFHEHIFFDNYSFPSTHVVFYTVFFGLLIFLALRLSSFSRSMRYFIGIVSSYLIIFVAVSRIMLGMHWINDVIGGYIFGLVFLLSLVIVYIKSPSTAKSE